MRSIKLIAVAAVMAACASAYAFQVTRDSGSLDKMVDDANAAIFRCVCTNAEPSTTNEISVSGYTAYTFKVLDMIKLADFARTYQKGDSFTFNQAGLNTKWMPRYACSSLARHEYLIFLSCNERTNLCAPVGMVLGLMDVARDPSGRAVVVGGVNRENLFKGVLDRRPQLERALTAAERETVNRRDTKPVVYDELASIIRKMGPDRVQPAGAESSKGGR